MIEFEQFNQEFREIQEDLRMLKEALHIDKLSNEISEMENQASEPGFWEDVERAQKIQTRINHLRRKISIFADMEKELEELMILNELGSEAEDLTVAEDIRSGLVRWKAHYHKLRLETLFSGEYDSHNAILSLHAGAGGTEAQDWVEMLFRMYSRWAEKNDFTLKVFDIQDGDEAGIKSCTFLLSGDNAYGYMRSEMGVHRLVRISPFDSSGRRHTSFASLEVIPELDDSIEINIKPEDLRVDTYRSSGAGGQHVNKTDSAVRLTHLPTGVVVACQNERSQIQNRETAMTMLKARLHALARASHMDRIEDLKGNQMDIAWGSQIRSYVFCPYTMVKDHRTGYETGNIQEVMDGELDDFIHAYLSGRKTEH
jgi:peptide chain release factor 2